LTEETQKKPLNNAQLAKAMKLHCKDYGQYEYEDMLDVLAEVIEQEVLKGSIIRLGNVGLFWLKRNPSKHSFSVINKEMRLLPETYTVGFKVAKQLNTRVREKTRQPIATNKEGKQDET
jgi:nucleoid DNA-binding protein